MHKNYPDAHGTVPGNLWLLPVWISVRSVSRSLKILHPVRNNDTISIECCHPDATGKFNQQTYDSLVELTAYLMGRFQLTTDDVIRHYDVTGKKCPLYYVEHEDAWQQFLTDVNQYIDTHGEVQEE